MKAVLIIDMPRFCRDCPLVDNDCVGEYCNAYDDDYIKIPDPMGVKPDWCPLRKLPEYMTGTMYKNYNKMYKAGYNACLDNILDREISI